MTIRRSLLAALPVATLLACAGEPLPAHLPGPTTTMMPDGGTSTTSCNTMQSACATGQQCLPTQGQGDKATGTCTDNGTRVVIRHTGAKAVDIWCGGARDPGGQTLPSVAPNIWTWCPVGVYRSRTADNSPWEVCAVQNGALKCTTAKDQDGFSKF